MKQGDQYYMTTSRSDQLLVIELVDNNPDEEYLLKTKVLATGMIRWINKDALLAKWKQNTDGIQGKLFTNDRTDKDRKMFNK